MKYIHILIAILFLTSCEDVIDLPLEEGPKRLVIDANINWDSRNTDAENKIQSIKLTETAGFYDLTVPVATGASVKITNTDNAYEFDFQEEPGNTGIYTTNDFIGVIDANYVLTIEYKGEEFTAEETMMPVADITSVVQTTENFFGTDVIRVDFIYTDPVDEENYYVGQFNYETEYITDVYRTWSDQFINGNEDSVFEQDESLIAGEVLILYFYGVSKTYHNYLDLLLEQITSGGPFSTPPAPVKGNCINVTNPDSKPLGYFRLSEMFVEEYVIQ